MVGWLVFIFLFIFLGKLIKLILVFPVNLILVMFSIVTPEKAPYVSEYGAFILNILLSFLLYTWTINTFVLSKSLVKKQKDPIMKSDDKEL